MTIPGALVTFVQPWATLYGNSQPVSLGVVFLHLSGVMVGGGRAIAADADVLGAIAPDRALVDRLGRAHRVVMPAFVVTAMTGVLMAAADVETFAVSSIFLVKLTFVTLLSLNGLLLWAAERRLAHEGRKGWGPTRFAAAASLALWLLTLLAGCWLQVAG